MKKDYRWTGHALENLVARNIDRQDAESVLSMPDFRSKGSGGREVLMGVYFDKGLGRRMLLRVVVEEFEGGASVITLYKTSRFGKYLPDLEEGEER